MGKTTHDELRRAPRVRVCCRVDVRQPHGVWSAVTGDLSARGCRIVTSQLPRLGTLLSLRLSSDLFAEDLYTTGEVTRVRDEEVGVQFVDRSGRNGAMTVADWVRRVLDEGSADAAELASTGAAIPERVTPVVTKGKRKGSPIPRRSRRRSG
jgi:PilZ domain-containing protein